MRETHRDAVANAITGNVANNTGYTPRKIASPDMPLSRARTAGSAVMLSIARYGSWPTPEYQASAPNVVLNAANSCWMSQPNNRSPLRLNE